MDGVEGTIKSKVYRDVKSGKVLIEDAKSFAEYADITIRNIKSLYLPLDDILLEPSEIDLAPKIKLTLEVHCVRREFTIDGIAKLKFLKMALEKSVKIHCCRYRSISTIRVPFAKVHTWPKRIRLTAEFATNGFMNAVS